MGVRRTHSPKVATENPDPQEPGSFYARPPCSEHGTYTRAARKRNALTHKCATGMQATQAP
eukprot:4072172-Alexandrium_andersonii.AAC.1